MPLRRENSFPRICCSGLLFAGLVFAVDATGQAPRAKDLPTIAREASSSVVRIILRDQSGAELATGSGFVISGDGKVVTDYHVVHFPGAVQAEIRFPDGTSYQVQGVLATDPDRDIAVLKLKAMGKEFGVLRLSSSDPVVGQHVIAIGSPLASFSPVSTEATVSDGIVSGIRDWPEHKMNVLQITAPISPGSSGGALLNSDGDVIGVTFAQLVL